MGIHYFTLYYDTAQSCDTIVPYQTVYSPETRKLNGIVFQHIATLESDV